MKSSLLLIGLGLGLLVTQEGIKADHPCSEDGYCYIHNATDQRHFVFDKSHELLKNQQYWIDGLSPYGLPVPENAFPITISTCQKWDQDDQYCKSRGRKITINDPHCYTFWRWITATDPWDMYKYWTTRIICPLTSKEKPQQGESSKNTPKSPEKK